MKNTWFFIWRFSKSLRTCPGNNESFRWILPQSSAQLPHCFRGAGNIRFAGFVNSWMAPGQSDSHESTFIKHSFHPNVDLLLKLKTPIRIIKAPTLAVIHLTQEGTNRSKNDMGWRTTSLHKSDRLLQKHKIGHELLPQTLPHTFRGIFARSWRHTLCLYFILI